MSKMKARRGGARGFWGGGGASTRGAAWAFARRRAAVWKPRARHGRVGRPRASTSTPSPRRGRGAKAWEEDGGGGVLPVNPPSPAFRGVRGPRRTRCRAAGPLAPSLGLHSRRKMTSLNRPAPRSPHTPDAIGSVFYAAMCGFAGLRGVCLRGVFVFDKTRGLLVIQYVFWLPPCAALATRYTIQGLRSVIQILLRSFVHQELPSIRRA